MQVHSPFLSGGLKIFQISSTSTFKFSISCFLTECLYILLHCTGHQDTVCITVQWRFRMSWLYSVTLSPQIYAFSLTFLVHVLVHYVITFMQVRSCNLLNVNIFVFTTILHLIVIHTAIKTRDSLSLYCIRNIWSIMIVVHSSVQSSLSWASLLERYVRTYVRTKVSFFF